MTGRIDARLAELGIVLPRPAAPAGAYVPFVVTGGLVFVSGQLPIEDGVVRHSGHLGTSVSVETGYEAARLCGINLLAQVREACAGDLDRVVRVVRIGGFVSCAGGFHAHPQVIDGASELMLAVFGDAGRHARFAVGAPALPLAAAVEVEGVFEIA
jgi:enamine deaminase RidA (YjgF/YER057c/UK114 family)